MLTSSYMSGRVRILGYLALLLSCFALGFSLESVTIRGALLGILLVVGTLLLTLPYEWAVRLLFAYLGFEGMAKLLTGYHPVVHVGADLLVVALTLRWVSIFLIRRDRLPGELPPLLPLFGAHFLWFLIQFANPYSIGLFPSLAGAKVYVTMVILYAFGFYLARDQRSIHGFMAIWVLTAMIQTLTGLVQAYIGPASVLSISSAYAAPLLKFKGYAFRPFGTTALAGGPSIYIYMASVFVIYFLFRARSLLARTAMLALLPAAVMTVVFCQVRSALLKVIIGALLFGLLLFSRMSGRARRRMVVLIPAAAGALIFVLPQLTSHWIEGNSDNQRAVERTMTLFDYKHASQARSGTADRVLDFAIRVPLGAGLSRTGAAAGKFSEEIARDPYFPMGFFTDNFWAATIAEIGIPGSLILTLIILSILWKGFRSMRANPDPAEATLQAAILCSLFMVVVGLWGAEGLLYNPEAAFFWFFSGVLMRINQGLDNPHRLENASA